MGSGFTIVEYSEALRVPLDKSEGVVKGIVFLGGA